MRQTAVLASMCLLASVLCPPMLWAQEAAPRTGSAQARTSVAILELEPKGVPEVEVSALSDRLRSELLNTGSFDVMERGKMQEVLKEQGFQQSGACNTDACAVEVGQLIGVERMIAGSLGRVGRTYTVNLRLISVKTGRIERSVTRDYAGEIDKLLTSEMKQVAQVLAASASGKQVSPQAKAPAMSKPIYKKWWFFAGLGTLAAGGAAAALLGGSSDSDGTTTPPEDTTIPLPPARP